MRLHVGRRMAVPVIVGMGLTAAVSMTVLGLSSLAMAGMRFLLCPELLPRQLLLAGCNDVNFGGADAATIDARDFEVRVHT